MLAETANLSGEAASRLFIANLPLTKQIQGWNGPPGTLFLAGTAPRG